MSASERPKSVIFLAGAPLRHEVDSQPLLNTLLPSVQRFVDGRTAEGPPDPTLPNNWPNWRTLNCHNNDEQLDDAQENDGENYNEFSFLSVASNQGDNLDFLEHSLAVYAQEDEGDADATMMTFDGLSFAGESFLSEVTENSFQEPASPQITRLPSRVTNLKDIPSAGVLERSYPQTITVDLIVGIISVAQARIIEVRKFKRSMQLVEVIVGDETRTGFPISFWLSASAQNISAGERLVRDQLEKLRSRQIVLVTNVALRVWQGNVYGGSLKSTLHRKAGTSLLGLGASMTSPRQRVEGRALPAFLLKKQERVQTWISNFLLATEPKSPVARLAGARGQTEAARFLANQLEFPPDTQ